MTQKQYRLQPARSICHLAGVTAVVMAAATAAGSAAAIDTLVHQAPQAIKVAQVERQPNTGSQAAPADTKSAVTAASESAGTYQPFALALAGALLMGYIGLRRPRE